MTQTDLLSLVHISLAVCLRYGCGIIVFQEVMHTFFCELFGRHDDIPQAYMNHALLVMKLQKFVILQ